VNISSLAPFIGEYIEPGPFYSFYSIMDEVQDVNGGGLLGAIVAVLLTPVSVPVAVGVSIAAAVVIGGAIIASRD
jgi:hypothetical protein